MLVRGSHLPWYASPSGGPLARNRLHHARTGNGKLDHEPNAATVVPPFQVLHSIPGRIRIHISDWQNLERSALEHRIRLIPGVGAVQANPLTRNVLIHFDPPGDGRERVLKLIDVVLRKCGASPRGLRPLSLPN